MTTLEKLFLQIFERKDRIIDQVQQQADSYAQQLASGFLIDGITPPPWLLSPNSNSQSDPNELEKEEIISKLLLHPPRDSTRYSTGSHSLYYRSVADGGNVNKPLSTQKCMETHAPNKDINEPNLTVVHQNNDIVGSLDCVPELDNSDKSPQNEIDARITSIYASPDKSLARIQRSKSRQKALELRSNGKTSAKSRLINENRNPISFSGGSSSKKDFDQVIQDKCPSDIHMSKLNNISGSISMAEEGNGEKGNGRTSHSHRLAKSSSSYEIPSSANEHNKIGPSSDKEELDGGIIMEPIGDSMQQSCHANDVMERVNLPDVCLGSYAGKNSISGKTQGTQSQNNLFCGRITRSRNSRQETSGINKSSKLGTSVSCNPKGEDALSHSVGDLMHELDISNKLSDVVKTSQVLSDINAEMQVICSIEGVLNPVTSSCIGIKESSLGANHQKNAEIVAGKGPIDEPVAMQAVNSGVKLDPVILCMESEGEECCINIKPKQLNFDESEECNLNEIFSSPSKRRKLDGLSGKECYPLKESASSLYHKSSCNSFEQQLSKANVMSSSPETARARSYKNIDESAKDEMKNIGLYMNENPVVEDVEHHSKFSLHDDIDATCEVKLSPKEVENKFDKENTFRKIPFERRSNIVIKVCKPKRKYLLNVDDFGHKGKESVAGIYIPISNINSSFASSLTKQGNNGFEDCLDKEVNKPEVDLDSSISKESEVGTNARLTNMTLSSAKVNTWPLHQQKNAEDQPHCFSDSRDFRVHIQRDAIHCDLEDSSKSKEFEVETDARLTNMTLSSAKVNTWPLHQQKNVEDQPNCFSDSRDFRVHIQRDAIHCDLETSDNDVNLLKDSASRFSSEKVHLTQSDDMKSCNKRVHDEMICDLSEGTESMLEIQAAEEIVTGVDDDDSTEITDMLKRSKPTCTLNLIKTATDDSTYSLEADVGPANSTINGDVAVNDDNNIDIDLPEWASFYGPVPSSQNDVNTMVVSDDITPVYESFIIADEIGNVNMGNNEGGTDFDTLEIPSTTIERASIIEQICKSASMQTPLSQFSSTFPQHQVQGLYGFMTDGILDHMDFGTTLSVDEDSRKHLQTSDTGITKIDSVFPQHQKLGYATPFDWWSKNHYSSPVGKLWERSASSSGSSEIQLSSNPDLTCFPIEEDPCGNEENENAEETHDELEENISPDKVNENPIMVSADMEIERRENDDEMAVENQEPPIESTEVCTKHGNHVSKSSMKYPYRYSSNSVTMEVSVPRTRDKVKHTPKLRHGIKVSRYEEENRNSSIATRASSRGNMSVKSIMKSSMRSGVPRLSQKEAKRNNIVSNITSFIPIVQQKQAAAVCTGKRDIKVKALEAAEAAKRLEQEKENERKVKKEALKLERAIRKENAKERENLKKQEDLKKKEADIAAARKRQREEEERKQLVKRRKLVAETQKNQKLKYDKSRVGKLETQKHVQNAGSKKTSENLRQNRNADENSFKKQDNELKVDKTLANFVQQVSSVPKSHDASNDRGEKDKVTSVHEISPVKVMPVRLTSQENSYDISPYQCSDDENDDEEDDLPTKKFIPSWASKTRVSMVLPLQKKLDPEAIFSVDSFCSMDEVLLPRRLQTK
ncbi:hypothetical protein SSX86_006848 [Deinandra increscens subsp. villosa]|uniref:Inner centromere protein ARK-binding domain-containing protein n=1 Tax=Deinandra increscens subsp. villosa TaxID=3103831 RepID=A0AAP0H6X9_9ASTR